MTFSQPHYLTAAQIDAWAPDPEPLPGEPHAARLTARLRETGQWHPGQAAGRRWAMGCVALEVTQRCNLDCTLCYLSHHSQGVPDLPLAELLERIAGIRRHYGQGTEVQITGVDTALRDPEELQQIVRAVRDAGMRPSLFTNGIRATRSLLRALAENGLADVAFHVDMTQQRRGYASERDLMVLREQYLERARGLPLGVVFNTTVFAGHFADVPEIVRFFRERAGRITLASFQLQADTGRSVLGGRPHFLTPHALAAQISRGAGMEVTFGFPAIGHGECNRYAICLEAGGRLYNLFAETPFLAEFVQRVRPMAFERGQSGGTLKAVFRVVLADPRLWTRTIAFLAAKLWEMKGGLFRSRGRVNKLSFFIHNFMDASALEPERCRACVFMVATREGPLSMCLHNAKRDRYILPAFTPNSPSAGTTSGAHRV